MLDKTKPLRVLDWKQVKDRVPFSRVHVQRLEKAGKFPKRVQLGVARIGWLEADIDKFILDRCKASGITLDDENPF